MAKNGSEGQGKPLIGRAASSDAANRPSTPATARSGPSNRAVSNKSVTTKMNGPKERLPPIKSASSQAQGHEPTSPALHKSDTERIAGTANRLLDNSSRLFVGYGRRPSAPAANRKDNKEPQTSPRIFEVGEAEKAAFRAASGPPYSGAAWSTTKDQARQNSGSQHATDDTSEVNDADQSSPNTTLPTNPSPNSMLQMLNGQPPQPSTRASFHSYTPLKSTHASLAPPKEQRKRRASLSRFFRAGDPVDPPHITQVEDDHPQTALKLMRKPSDTSLRSMAASEPNEPAADITSLLETRSILSSPVLDRRGAPSPPHVRFQHPPLDGARPPADPNDVLDRAEAPPFTDDLDFNMQPELFESIEHDSSGGLVHVSSTRESSPYFVQDRVLVSWGRSRNEHLPADLNEKHARRFDIEMEAWRECMLVAKGQMLEIYTSHHVANRVRSSHRLLDRIPLEASTTLSLFSPADYTFMMTCPEHSRRRRAVANRLRAGFKPSARLQNLMKKEKHEKNKKGLVQGSAIFAIRAQCPSIAQDFYWHIWRALGKKMPSKLEVALPSLGARFAFKLPSSLEEARLLDPNFQEPPAHIDPMYWSALTSEVLIAAAKTAVESVPEWQEIAAHADQTGLTPGLAWRRANYLDWVRHGSTVTGQRRPWALVAGFAMSEFNFGINDGLEMRLAAPYPKTVPALNGVKQEPASIEGPCIRLHGVGYKDHIYLFTLGPHLFIIPEQAAAKPADPGEVRTTVNLQRSPGFFQHIGKAFALNKPVQEVHREGYYSEEDSSKASTSDYERGRQFEKDEMDRYLRLIKSARGFLHLCDIQSVKIANPSEDIEKSQTDDSVLGEFLEQVGQEKEDETRAFVIDINMQKGRQLKIEVVGLRGSLQWVYRLRLLADYWRARGAADSKEQLSFNPEHDEFGRPCLRNRCGKDIVKDPSPTGKDAFLNLVFNWSIVTGARGYTLSGILFTKDESRTQYRRRYCFLIRGCLFFYKVKAMTFSKRPAQHTWHPVKGMWDLKDSYVISQGALCSGWKVATDDPEYKPGEHFGPRIYEDGLRTADEDEDCSLAIWKRIGSTYLTKKSQVIILRTRSKIERDQWAYALNCEIESLVRDERQGER